LSERGPSIGSVGASALVTDGHVFLGAPYVGAVSITVTKKIVTPVGEFRRLPGIAAIGDKSIVDVQEGSAPSVGRAGERHQA
jgi:hypothetical protein